jgi:glycosyl transferase family 87
MSKRGHVRPLSERPDVPTPVRIRWNEPLGSSALLGLVGVALLVLVLSFRASVRPVDATAGSDVTVYQRYGSSVVGGAVPYRDFDLEYPPGALVMFVAPALVEGGAAEEASWSPPDRRAQRYYRGFTFLVGVLLGMILVLTALTLREMRRPAIHAVLALGVVACSPLLLGQVVIERFDVLPATLVAAALAASVRGRHRPAAALLGLGAAAKFYPALLVPVVAIAAFRERGRREAVAVLAVALAATLAVYIPFAVASPADTWESLLVQLQGGLQIETLPSSTWVLANHAADALGIGAFRLTAQGGGEGLIRFDLAGPGVQLVQAGTTVLLVAALGSLWFAFRRSRRETREEMLRCAAATVAALLVLGTILSPQYLAWLLPVVPLVGGRRGVAALAAFVVAAYLTNLWIPDRYLDYQADLELAPTTFLFARNLALLAVLLILIVPARVHGATSSLDPRLSVARKI